MNFSINYSIIFKRNLLSQSFTYFNNYMFNYGKTTETEIFGSDPIKYYFKSAIVILQSFGISINLSIDRNIICM